MSKPYTESQLFQLVCFSISDRSNGIFPVAYKKPRFSSFCRISFKLRTSHSPVMDSTTDWQVPQLQGSSLFFIFSQPFNTTTASQAKPPISIMYCLYHCQHLLYHIMAFFTYCFLLSEWQLRRQTVVCFAACCIMRTGRSIWHRVGAQWLLNEWRLLYSKEPNILILK